MGRGLHRRESIGESTGFEFSRICKIFLNDTRPHHSCTSISTEYHFYFAKSRQGRPRPSFLVAFVGRKPTQQTQTNTKKACARHCSAVRIRYWAQVVIRCRRRRAFCRRFPWPASPPAYASPLLPRHLHRLLLHRLLCHLPRNHRTLSSAFRRRNCPNSTKLPSDFTACY